MISKSSLFEIGHLHFSCRYFFNQLCFTSLFMQRRNFSCTDETFHAQWAIIDHHNHFSSLRQLPSSFRNVGRNWIRWMMPGHEGISIDEVSKVCKLWIGKCLCSYVRQHLCRHTVLWHHFAILNLVPCRENPPINVPWLFWKCSPV